MINYRRLLAISTGVERIGHCRLIGGNSVSDIFSALNVHVSETQSNNNIIPETVDLSEETLPTGVNTVSNATDRHETMSDEEKGIQTIILTIC